MLKESQTHSSRCKYNQLFTLLKRKYFSKMNFYVILFMFIHGTSYQIFAQSIFGIKDILIYGKNITLRTLVRGTYFVDSLKKNNTQIIDGGTTITNFTTMSKDSNDRSECLSAAFVIDRTGSLAWDGMTMSAVQRIFSDFVCGFDGSCDECAVVSFGGDVRLDVPLTNDRTEIQKGIYNLQANGATALWDATVVALNELITKAHYKDKFIILFTDGEDVLSTSNGDTVLSLAKANNIQVFTLGLGTGVNREELQKLALETGGNFYLLPSPSQLFGVMNDIYSRLVRRYTQSIITYQSPVSLLDGSIRNGQLIIKGNSFCLNGSDSYQYRLPCDSSRIQPIDLVLDDASGQPGSIVPVKLKLQTKQSITFERFNGTISFDSTLLQLYGYDKAGYFLGDLGCGIVSNPSSVNIWINASKNASSNADLLLFTFRILPVQVDTQTQIIFKNWTFSQGCVTPIFHSGTITIKVKPLNMITPLPNEILCAGNSQFIQWVNKNVNTVRIELSSDGGITFPKILVDSIDASIGSWLWNIPVSQQEGNKYMLRVVDVSNPSTESRTQGTFTIKPPTAILVQPKNQTIKEGQSAAFTVTASGVDLKYQWKKDGVIIPGIFNSSYSISQVQIKDEGNYSVVVTGKCGTIESQPARLTIITTSVSETRVPKDVTLYQNFPNPFRDVTTITFSLSRTEYVTLKVFDLLGREVRLMKKDFLEEGEHHFTFDANNLPNGIYFYTISTSTNRITREAVILR